MSKKYKNDEDLEFEPIETSDLDEQSEKNIKDFTDLLDTLSSLHDKKKTLWKQIYINAITDRRNAYIMYGDLYKNVHGSSAEHAIHGQTLAKYLERMNKSNEQIIKLAEILDEAVEADEKNITDPDNIYDLLEKNYKQ